MRWLVAVLILLLAVGAACWPEKHSETALTVREASSVPSRENHATEWTPPPTEPPRTTIHRSSRSQPRARTAPRGKCARQRTLEEIARDESGGNYTAQNPRSTASGKYQVLDGTWDGYGGYRRAKDAPPEVQEQWAREAYAKAGSRPWRASGC